MKHNMFATIGVTFILGALAGISIVFLLSFSRSIAPSTPRPEPGKISPQDAHTFVQNYLAGTDAPSSRPKGVYLDLAELAAMNQLINEDATLKGFRVYFGKALPDRSSPVFGIVVGVNDKDQDLYLKTIYRTDSPKTGPCPPICDVNSPITKD